MKRVFLFDIDGTLTHYKSIIDSEFKKFFIDFAKNNDVYLVTGSDYHSAVEQVTQDVIDVVKKVYCCMGNECWVDGVKESANELELTLDQQQFLENKLENSPYQIRTGIHFEYRTGMLNFSIVGRQATPIQRKEYGVWDMNFGERLAISQEFNNKYTTHTAQVGGEISIDITKAGLDKSQVKKDFDGYEIHFFGDRIKPGGNDYPLAQANKDGFNYQVESWKETFEYLRKF